MANLLINIDHVATLRNARREAFPDPVHAAVLCELAGADGIVFHLREDRRHIHERDVYILKETVKGTLDFELAMAQEVMDICCKVKPHLATLVPEKREEVTTEGGLEVIGNLTRVQECIAQLHENGIAVNIFVDPIAEQIQEIAQLGADGIELHTGDFANARSEAERLRQAQILAEGANLAHSLGLHVHAGHGLDYHNYNLFKNTVPHIREVSIGFAIIARAVFVGMERAVKEMLDLVK
jgi:pyridoxine 5-phosphate synthase